MPLQDASVPIAFGKGFDTKTDPKAVIQGKLLDLVDGVFTNPNRISKRNGYDAIPMGVIGGGSISSPLMCQTFRNELIAAATASGVPGVTGQRLYAFSETDQKWSDKGKYVSTCVTKQSISGGTVNEQNSFSAEIGNIAIVTYDVSSAGSLTSKYSVVDLDSGTHIVSDLGISGSAGYARVVALGGTQFAIFYMNSSNVLCYRLVTFSSGLPILGSQVSTSLALISSGNFPVYDVLQTVSGGLIVAGTPPNNLVAQLISTSGVLGTSATVALGNAFLMTVNVSQGSNGNYWIYWATGSTTSSEAVKYAVLSPTLASVLIPTTISASTAFINQMASIEQSASTQTFYFSEMFYGSTGAGTLPIPIYSTIFSVLVSDTGTVGSPAPTIQNADIYSKPFSYNGANYLALMTYSAFQATGFVVDLLDNAVVAKFLPEIAEGYILGPQYPGKLTPGAAASVRYPGYLNYPFESVSGKFAFSSGYQINGVSGLSSTLCMGSALTFIDFDNFEAYQGIGSGDGVVLNGGVLQIYDGNSCSELGFNQYPDNIQATITTGGSSAIADGEYDFAFTYQWTDIQGNVHESSSNPTTITFSGGPSTVAFQIATLGLTQKNNVKITVWMSQLNGEILYQAQTSQINNSANSSVTITITSQPSLTSKPLQLYTSGGVVENIAPPPAMVLMSNQNRIWLVDSENPRDTIWYSKTFAPGTGLSFSDFLTLTIDSKFGEITSMIGMDEKTCIIKEIGILISTGDGADDTGSNATFTNPQVIPSDVGGLYSRGTILIPDGVIFKTTKGLYLLSRGLTVSYFGAEAESFNAQDIQSAIIVPETSQVRFLTSTGSSLVYDYIFKQWSRFSNHSGYSSINSNGVYVYVRADGKILKENTSTFLDDTSSFALKARVAWIKTGGIQGFQRVREAFILGDHKSPSAGHGVNISAAYDFNETFLSTIGYLLPIQSNQTSFQYREFMPRQKCDSLSLLIQEIVTGASGEYLDFTDLTLNLGVKRGQNKLPASQSVG